MSREIDIDLIEPPDTAFGNFFCLSKSAQRSLFLKEKNAQLENWKFVTSLMRTHGWSYFRAWRHWQGCSKSEMARRIGIHFSTYEFLDDGSVELGCWLQPAVAWRLHVNTNHASTHNNKL